MDLTVSDADIEVLADRLTVVMNDAYKQGQQAERERIKDIIKTVGVQCDNGTWVKCETIMEKIHDVS